MIQQHYQPLESAKQKLYKIGLGWALVAMTECVAYAYLALALINKASISTLLSSAIIAIIITVVITRAGFLTGISLAGDLYSYLGESLSKTKPAWFTIENRALTSKLASQSIPQLMSIPAHQLQGLIHAPLIPLGVIITMGLVIDLYLATVTLLVSIFALGGLILSQFMLKKIDKNRHNNGLKQYQAYSELVENTELLKSFNGSTSLNEIMQPYWEQESSEKKALNNKASLAIIISYFCQLSPIIIIVGIAASLSYPLEFLLAIAILSSRITAPLEGVALAVLNWHDLLSLFKNYQKVTEAPKLKQPSQITTISSNPLLNIAIERHNPVLRSINISIPYGERVWIKGNSGAGKSTLVELLMRFDDPEHGGITLDGIPLNEISSIELAKKISYVPQDPILFTGTLFSNIAYGMEDVEEDLVRSVANKMQLTNLINRHPLGIQQSVGQQGSALSGGEIQRVGLARALLKNAPILILDEATSALDEETEKLIVSQIMQLNCTVIFITHKDGSLWNPSKIVDLNNSSTQ